MYKKLAIYFLALLGNIGMTLISPIMANMAMEFPDASEAMLGMVVTLPAFTLMPALFVSSALLMKVERKNIIVAAYLLALIGGVGPAFCSSLPLIMVCRGILGVGMGLVTPIQATYVAEYPEKERPGLFGLSQTVNGLLAAGLILLVAPVAAFGSWRAVFMMYGVVVILFIIIMTGLPKTGKLGGDGTAADTGHKQPVKVERKSVAAMVIYCVAQFCSMAVMATAMSSMSFYIERYQLGDAGLASIASSAATVCMAVAAALFPLMMKKFKNWTGTVMLAISVISLLIYYTHTVAAVIIGYCLIFTFVSLYSVYASTSITMIVPLPLVALMSSISTVSIFGGQFIAPYIQQLAAMLLGVDSADAAVYLAFAVLVLVMAVINIPFKKKQSS